MNNKNINGIIRIILHIFYLFPIKKNKFFLMCFDGTKLGFDQKAFVDWAREKNIKYDFIWGVKTQGQVDIFKLYDVKFVKIKSIRGIYEMMTSKIIMYNINAPSYIPFRKKQILINTWHGYVFKKCGKYAPGFDKKQANLTNCFLSHSKEYTENFIKDSLEYSGEVLPIGTPRTDVLFDSDKLNKNSIKVRKEYRVPSSTKIVLFAPTFRNDYSEGEINIDFKRLLDNLKKKFGNEWIIMLRLHPLIANKQGKTGTNIVDVSNHNDIVELLCAADILITDYSSCIWDFGLTKKPGFLFEDDREKYNKDRGLIENMENIAFPLATSNDELEKLIMNFDNKKYTEELDKWYKKIGCYDNGECCMKLNEYINERIKELN